MVMRIRRMGFCRPWERLPDCVICKIPECGSRWAGGDGVYDCPRRKMWNKTKDPSLARKVFLPDDDDLRRWR